MASLIDNLKSLSDLTSYSRKPVPNTPDGLTDTEATAPILNKPQEHGKLFTIIESIQDQIKRGVPLDLDHSTISAIVDALMHSQSTGINDRNLLLEKVFTLLERLPPDSDIQNRLTDAVITLLYNDLPHPPATALGPEYEYRTPDGSYNNVDFPNLGKAKTPYTRSVQSKNPTPYSSLPDPGLIFDTLLRRDGFKPHPSGISSLMFAFANLIIHSLFKTDDTNVWQNNTSSYLDLSPLYGCSLEEQLTVRNIDGRGLLYEDTFADQRLLMMPPATPALLLMFSRNHNYIATKLLQINERNTYISAETLAKGKVDEKTMRAQDDEIFNKAKLVNCGHFVNIILSDYIGAILGVTKEGNDWALNPLNTIRSLDRELTPRGQGNNVSVEFNLLYRWHAVISQPDEIWAEKLFDRIFPDIPNSWQTICPKKFKERIQQLQLGPSVQQPTMGAGTGKGSSVPPPPSPSTKAGGPAGPASWTFANLKRDQKTGRFNDDDLAKILHDATSTVSQAFRGRGTPAVMRVVEMIAIEQARAWGVGSLNEFRQFIGLKAYTSFEEWNPDKEIAQAARALYGHIDNLELYVGMQAEEAKTPGPGAGLCPGYTISRAILADAVALTRGDRFLTTDFTPYNLSSWGFQDCARDKKNGAFGSCMSKILLRNLPGNYTFNNVYGLFAFYTPETMNSILTNLKIQEKYAFDRPVPKLPVLTVNSWDGLTRVLGDSKTFRTIYSKSVKNLTNGYGFFIAEDEPEKHLRDFQVIHDAFYPKDPVAREHAIRQYSDFYQETTQRLLLEKSASVVGTNTRTVDVVRDVCNLIPVHWVSEHVAGIPLKDAKHPHGVHTEQQVYQYLMVVFTYIFLNIQPETGWLLQESAEQVAPVFLLYIETHIAALKPKKGLNKLKDSLLNWFTGESDAYSVFLQRVASSNLSTKILSYNILGIIIASSANFSMAAALIVNFYLDEARAAERAEIIRLAHGNTKEGDALLMGYVLEALRIEPQAPGFFREAAVDAEVTEGNGLPAFKVKRGQTLFISVQNASMDPTVFPNPGTIDPTRPVDKYKIFGGGMHACLGQFFVLSVMPQVIRTIFSLKNVRRAPGLSGVFNRFEQDLFGSTRAYMYLNANGDLTPWPASMHIQYDL